MRRLQLLGLLLALMTIMSACTHGQNAPSTMRFATFNIRELSTDKITTTDAAGVGVDPGIRAAATIIQSVRPDVLLLNEIDHDYASPDNLALNAIRFRDSYLRTGQNPIDYPYIFVAPNNTGILSGRDLDRNGIAARPTERGTREHGGDAFGYGEYPGQYSMALLSRYPLEAKDARTFQGFLWRDLPDNLIPRDWYNEADISILRLSSKSHWDVPIRLGNRTVHLLCSHPTPRGFDGEEDRNGRRNFDEVGFWARYIDGSRALYDDTGKRGGLAKSAEFIVMGDLNTNPGAKSSRYRDKVAIDQLLDHPRVQDTGAWTVSEGALLGRTPGPPKYFERNTIIYAEGSRVDYVLPSIGLTIKAGGVFWPDRQKDAEGNALAEVASDHRIVWVDISTEEP